VAREGPTSTPAKPKPQAAPKANAAVKPATAKPKTTAKPKATAKPRATAKPKAAAKPTASPKPKAKTQPEPKAAQPKARPRAKGPGPAKPKNKVRATTRPATPGRGSRPSALAAGSGGVAAPVARRDRVVVEQAAQRFAERARARRRAIRRKVAALVAGVAAVAGLGWVAFFSPVLGLDPQQVVVVGDVPVAQVHAVVARHAGEPLPRLDTAALRSEILAVHGVKDARVVRDWPRGLTVTVTPRVAAAAVVAGDHVLLVDLDGVQLGTGTAAPAGLPLVEVGDDPRALAAALAVVGALPADLVAQVATISAPTQDTVSLALVDGVEVVWGSAEDSALKVQVVATLRAEQTLTDVTTIDVSAPRRPVVR